MSRARLPPALWPANFDLCPPHRDVLAVRGLAQRGKLSTNDPVLHFLARIGDNGVVWHILTYWRPTE